MVRYIKMVGYGENSLGFFMLEGKAEVVPNENNSKIVYFDLYNEHLDEYYESEEEDKKQDEELAEMNRYLKKKRLLSSKIGKMKFVRYYMPKPEIKKRRKRTIKATAKAEEEQKEALEANESIQEPILQKPINETNVQISTIDHVSSLNNFQPAPESSHPTVSQFPYLQPNFLSNPFQRPNALDMSSIQKELFSMHSNSPNFVSTPNFPQSNSFFDKSNFPSQIGSNRCLDLVSDQHMIAEEKPREFGDLSHFGQQDFQMRDEGEKQIAQQHNMISQLRQNIEPQD
jgi:hypothetical protein